MKTIVNSLKQIALRRKYSLGYGRPHLLHRSKVRKQLHLANLKANAHELVKNGILILPGYFKGAFLEEIKSEFQREMANSPKEGPEPGQFNISSEALHLSPALSQAAVDEGLLLLLEYYWGKPIFLAECNGKHIEPLEEKIALEVGVKSWHHDAKRKQVKAMILLTDVEPDGQRMDYIPGSHKVWHKFESHEETRFSEEKALKFGSPIPCSGPAGTVVLFDTNGIHTPNRNSKMARDTWTYNYTAGKHLFPFKGLNPDVISHLTSFQKRVARL